MQEKDTTKHVHRLHPYKGKFIPQLVEYFIDNHVDDFKTSAYFKTGDIILDPFSKLKTTSHYAVLPTDSRTVNIFKKVEKEIKNSMRF